MKSEERRAATQEMRRRLEELRKAVAEQDARLAEAHAQADARSQVFVPPQARERFELLCVAPARPARAGHDAAKEWGAVRC
jgi:hypothetical protein